MSISVCLFFAFQIIFTFQSSTPASAGCDHSGFREIINLYEQCSKAFMNILREYSPCVEQYSIDEAFVDMTETKNLWGDPLTAATKLKNQIRDSLGFTVNIDISANKLLAKMASDFQKPDRIHSLWKKEIPDKMWPLPVSELFFVGKATTKNCLILESVQ